MTIVSTIIKWQLARYNELRIRLKKKKH